MSRAVRRAVRAAMPLAAIACGSGRAPIYTLEPAASPLRYAEQATGTQTIQTPGGPQRGEFSTGSEVRLAVGPRSGEGRRFTVTYEGFSATLPGSGTLDASALSGAAIPGVIGPDGAIVLGTLPDVSAGSIDGASLAGIVPDLLPPLPPDGSADAVAWPHRYSLPTGGGLEGEIVFDGAARFAGDTTIAGLAVRRIVSEGTVEVTGRGIPAGAPGEIEMELAGGARTVYFWDPARGVLVASDAESSTGGTVSTMGFDLPMTMAMERKIRLVP